MLNKDVWESSDLADWIKHVDGRSKFTVLFMFSLLMITIDNPRTLFYLFSITLALHLCAGTSKAKWQVLALLIMLSLWGSMFGQALFFAQTPRTPLFTLIPADASYLGTLTGGLCVYREGIIYGAVQGLRSSSMLALGLLICWSSDARQLLKALTAWKLPDRAAFMLVTAIRFLPVLATETAEILTALQLRSNSLKGRKSYLRHIIHVPKPLLTRCLRRSQTLAMSVVSRGFLSASAKSGVREKLPYQEKIICLAVVFTVMALIFTKIVYILAEQGIYDGRLRLFYDFARLYL